MGAGRSIARRASSSSSWSICVSGGGGGGGDLRRGEEGTKEGTKEIAFLLEASPCRGVVIASFGSCLQARELYAAFLDLSSDAEDLIDRSCEVVLGDGVFSELLGS